MWMLLAFLQTAPAEAAECRATPAAELVGERYRRGVPTRAKRLSGARTVRVLWPGEMMTTDFRANRVNLRVNHRRLITAVSCG